VTTPAESCKQEKGSHHATGGESLPQLVERAFVESDPRYNLEEVRAEIVKALS